MSLKSLLIEVNLESIEVLEASGNMLSDHHGVSSGSRKAKHDEVIIWSSNLGEVTLCII